MIKFNYQVPIKEAQTKDKEDEFVIEGTAINATTTGNGHKFLEEELEPSASTLTGVALLKDHKNEIDSIMGRVVEGKYTDKKVEFRAKVIDKNAQAMIKDGRLDSVSVGCMVDSIEMDEDDESMIMRGITFRELSLVAVGADEGATFGMALEEAYKLTTDKNNKEEIAITKEKVDDPAPETFTKEQLDAAVAERVEKALETKDAEIAEAKATLEAEEKAEKEIQDAKDAALLKVKEAEEKAAAEKKIADEKAAKIAEEAEEKETGRKFVESYGSLGTSMTMERVI